MIFREESLSSASNVPSISSAIQLSIQHSTLTCHKKTLKLDYYNPAFCFNSLSIPGEYSCGASGICGMSNPSGRPSNASTSPSPNGDSPLNISASPDFSLENVHC